MNGTPWHPVGYYPAIGSLTADQTDYENYYRLLIDRQAEHGINYFRNVFTMGQPFGQAMTVYQRTGPGLAADGRPRFDLTRFNEEYFAYWRRVVEYARARGVVVQLCLLDSWHNKRWVVEDGGDEQHQWGMKYDFYQGANNINGLSVADRFEWHDPGHPVFAYQSALIWAVVQALGDLPNIVFEISNENYTNPEWERMLADYLTECERARGLSPHLVMPRDLPNHDQAGGKKNDPEQAHRELVANFGLGKPLIADNDGGGDATPEGRRKKAWACLTAGGYIDYFHFEMRNVAVLLSEDAAEGMRYVGLVGKFLREFPGDLRGMRPADELVTAGWCLAQPGERYVLYLPAGGSTTVSALPTTRAAWWFNPRDGSSTGAGQGPTFTAPDGQDWVLYIARAGQGRVAAGH